MQNRIEPPILMSRILTFVLAGTLVVLFVMLLTLWKMFPLNRPQIFFLTTTTRDSLEVTLTELPPQDKYLDDYKYAFIREYIKIRNEIVPNTKVMVRKWANNGAVRTMSTDAVFKDFARTTAREIIMSDPNALGLNCPVEFHASPMEPRAPDTYAVRFRYFCADNRGQTYEKDYKIRIKLITDPQIGQKWNDRLENPLGLRVAEYTVETGDGDPLDIEFGTGPIGGMYY